MEDFLNPSSILASLNLKEDMVAADFGSGSGGWVFPLARRLEEGKIFAVDALQEPLSALASRAKMEKIWNIETLQTDVETGVKIPPGFCDLVLMTNLLFECDDKKKVLQEGQRVLKEGGRILVVDWKVSSRLGPEEGRISSEDVKKMAEEIGLKLQQESEAGKYHYLLVFEK